MAMMKRGLAVLSLLLAGACASTTHTSPDAQVLMEADARFAAESATSGSPAWGKWFATRSIQRGADGEWTMGSKAVAEDVAPLIGDGSKPGAGTLTWYPTEARISPAGNVGTTWGHYLMKTSKRTSHGTYMTVWEKQTDGSWKVIFDTGEADPKQ